MATNDPLAAGQTYCNETGEPMNPWQERTLSAVIRHNPALPGELDVWLTLYDGGEINRETTLSIRGPLGEDELPPFVVSMLRELLREESARVPRLG